MPFGSSSKTTFASAPPHNPEQGRNCRRGGVGLCVDGTYLCSGLLTACRDAALQGTFTLPFVHIRARSCMRPCHFAHQSHHDNSSIFTEGNEKHIQKTLQVNKFTSGRSCCLQAIPKGYLGCVSAWHSCLQFTLAHICFKRHLKQMLDTIKLSYLHQQEYLQLQVPALG